MNGSNRVLLLVSVGLLLLTSQAQATVVFQDGFEGYTAASSWPSGAPDTDPGTPPVGDPWYVGEPAADIYGVQVLDIAAGMSNNSAGPHGGAKYLQTVFGGQGDVADAILSTANQALVTQNGNLTLDMWVFKNSLDGYNGEVRISGMDGANRAFDLYFKDDGSVDYDDGTKKSTGLTTGAVEVWQHLTVAANFATDTYDVTLGNQTVTGLAFASGTISKIELVRLWGVGYYVDRGSYDDILMTTIPEPSTLALLIGGLFGLLAYAWRKRR